MKGTCSQLMADNQSHSAVSGIPFLQLASFTIMHRTYKHSTKARLRFSGGPHAPVSVVDSMEEVNVGGKKCRK